jgi:hypothetical protein
MNAANLREATLDFLLYFVGVRETGSNKGPWVEAFQRLAGITAGADPWCMAIINASAERAAARLGVRSPLENMRLQGYVPCLVETFPHVSLEDALPGDILAVWNSSKGRHAHVAMIECRMVERNVRTVEGNTNEAGSREGDGVYRKVRTVGPKDVIVRWTRNVVSA